MVSMEFETLPDGTRTGLVSGPGSIPKGYLDWLHSLQRPEDDSER